MNYKIDWLTPLSLCKGSGFGPYSYTHWGPASMFCTGQSCTAHPLLLLVRFFSLCSSSSCDYTCSIHSVPLKSAWIFLMWVKKATTVFQNVSEKFTLPTTSNWSVGSSSESRLVLRIWRDLPADKNTDERKMMEQKMLADCLSSFVDKKYPQNKRHNSVYFRHHWSIDSDLVAKELTVKMVSA